jgi:hypothetical protein
VAVSYRELTTELTPSADGHQDNSSARIPRKTWPLLLRSADGTENTTHVVPTQRVHCRADCCLANSYKHSSCCCVFTISLPSNGNILPIVGQEFVFAGTCLPSCSIETDIHVTIFNCNTVIKCARCIQTDIWIERAKQ